MSIGNILRRSYSVNAPCEYLLQMPAAIAPPTPLVLCLHGYGMNPQDMLRVTTSTLGPDPIIVSLRAPYPHYVPRPGPHATVGYHWGVSTHWEEAVQLHHAMIFEVLRSVSAELQIPSDRTFLLGFSQPVGLNYRFVATYAGVVRGVIGICGGVPRDWEESKYQTIDAAILHISRDQDEFYPTEQSLEFPNRLRRYASDVEFHMLPGAHRFPSNAGQLIQSWMARTLSSELFSG